MEIRKKIEQVIPSGSQKKVILYGLGGVGVTALCLLKRFGKKIDYIVDGDEEKQGQYVFGIEVKSPYDLLYENKDNLIILVTVSMAGGTDVAKVLEGMGYIYNKHYFMTLGTEFYAPFPYIDPILSYSRGCEDFEKVPIATGKAEESRKKVILTLGGSTTDGSFYGIKSWPYYLQQKLGKGAQIYNGGACGYTSSQELLKLVRDGFSAVKPDIVISYSGLNDSMSDAQNFTLPYFESIMGNLVKCYRDNIGDVSDIYYGNEEENAQRYIINMRMMKGICEEMGSKFIAILQPTMWTGSRYMTDSIEQEYCELPSIERKIKTSGVFYDRVVKEIETYSYIYDFTQIFNDEKRCFYEWVHCNEKGNEIIADRIYKLLIDKEILDLNEFC